MRLTTKRCVWLNIRKTTFDLPNDVFKLKTDWTYDLMGVSGIRVEGTLHGRNIEHIVFVPWSNVLSLKQDQEETT